MGQAGQEPVLTADDYLAWEPAQFDRHEYLDGEVYRPHHLAHQCLDGPPLD